MPCVDNEKSEMMFTRKYKIWKYISKKKTTETDLGVVIEDNLSPEKHKIFWDTHRLFKNTSVAFHFLDKDMIKKIISTIIKPKLEYAEKFYFSTRIST